MPNDVIISESFRIPSFERTSGMLGGGCGGGSLYFLVRRRQGNGCFFHVSPFARWSPRVFPLPCLVILGSRILDGSGTQIYPFQGQSHWSRRSGATPGPKPAVSSSHVRPRAIHGGHGTCPLAHPRALDGTSHTTPTCGLSSQPSPSRNTKPEWHKILTKPQNTITCGETLRVLSVQPRTRNRASFHTRSVCEPFDHRSDRRPRDLSIIEATTTPKR